MFNLKTSGCFSGLEITYFLALLLLGTGMGMRPAWADAEPASDSAIATSFSEQGTDANIADDQEAASLPTEKTLLALFNSHLKKPVLSKDGLSLATLPTFLESQPVAPTPDAIPLSQVQVPDSLFQAQDLEPNAESGALTADTASRDLLAQESDSVSPETETLLPELDSPVGKAEFQAQASYLQQGGDLSARLRVGGIYTLSPSVFAGATVDLTAGNAFSDSPQTGLDLNELYLTASPANLPELRFTVGLMDLTSYFDRNSFAKDAVTHFFNPVFQTNPALSAANISSRPGALVNWTPLDQVSLTAAAFSSSRNLGSFALDSFAGEVGVRFGNAILRGTYVTGRDAGYGSGFQEVFAVARPEGTGFGPQPGDREEGFGLNAEYFIPEIKLGLFGRYGWYNNLSLAEGGSTYSFGVNALDLFLPEDRLGLAYGRQLSNGTAQQASGRPTPDVLELFYDMRLSPNLRAGVSVQERNAFTETYLGVRVRYDLGSDDIERLLK